MALDDTGHEAFAPTHPAFGLGGCACLAGDYGPLIDAPWRAMKTEHFSGPDAPLHAAELRAPSESQIAALDSFFRLNPFFRFAVVAARYADLQTEHSLMKIVSSAIMYKIGNIAKWCQPTAAALIIERSERIDKDLIFETSGWNMDNGDVTFQPQIFLLPKSANSSLLEVADFVIHTAGSHVRRRFAAHYEPGRDFLAVFKGVDQRLCHYDELIGVRDGAV